MQTPDRKALGLTLDKIYSAGVLYTDVFPVVAEAVVVDGFVTFPLIDTDGVAIFKEQVIKGSAFAWIDDADNSYYFGNCTIPADLKNIKFKANKPKVASATIAGVGAMTMLTPVVEPVPNGTKVYLMVLGK